MAKEDPNAPENAVDMNRYYYRPGTTEPELRPEIAEAEAAKSAPKPETTTTTKTAAKAKVARKK